MSGHGHFGDRVELEPHIRATAWAPATGVCGVPDHPGGLMVRRFGAPSNRFDHGNLTYSIDTTGANLNGESPVPADVPGEIAGIMDTVMKTWQAAVPGFFRFSKAPAGSSGDIHVQFGDSSLNPHFGAVTDNWDGAGSFPGNIALSSVRSWTRRVLHDVLLHEVGHGLGLAHSDAAASTMNHTVPTLSGLNPLDAETLRAIKLLYGWREPVQLPDRASSDGPALATTWFANFTSSTYTLHMAWKGVTGDEGLWYASSSDGVTWSPQESIGFARSAHGPALCAYDRENLAILYRGPSNDQALHFAINPGGAGWRGAAAPVGWSAHRPALIAFGPTAASLIAAWRGMDADQSLWWSRFDGRAWTPQQLIPGVASSHGPALVQDGDKLRMVWKGAGDDRNIWTATFDGAAWSPQQKVGYPNVDGSGVSAADLEVGTSEGPAVAAWNGELMMVWKGIPGDFNCWAAPLRTDGWSGQVSIPRLSSNAGPGIALLNGKLVVTMRGAMNDQSLWVTALSDQGTHTHSIFTDRVDATPHRVPVIDP